MFRNSKISVKSGEAFRTLYDAKIIRLIYPTTDLHALLKTDLKTSPRLQFLDTGLVNYSLGTQGNMLATEDLMTQEVMSLQSISAYKPNFWVREKS